MTHPASLDSDPSLPQARARIRDLPGSKIRQIANAAFGAEGIDRFWFGESDRPTPDYIKEAAIAAIRGDQTYYVHNSGRADLRATLGSYLRRLHGAEFAPERIAVTSSGVSALNIAMQAILDPGDRVVVVTPIWPNVAEIPRILGAEVVRVGLRLVEDEWRLDLDRLLEAITPDTRLVIINSPNNPTGWTLGAEERAPILERCRRHGVWLLVDDVYERLTFREEVAPSFLAMSDPDDRIIGANSFSKAWLMTGWRLGWLVTPAALEADLAKLIEFNTSCAPDFIQAAGLTAIEQGEPHIQELRTALRANRDRLRERLSRLPGVEAPQAAGGMYQFFRVRGHEDSMSLARRLVTEAGLGLAPGEAFGPEGAGWLRWCFAAAPDALERGAERLERWLEASN